MKKVFISLALIATGSMTVFAQYDLEAFKFSRNMYQSDARATGVGNAYGAVGANFFSASINPAGLGLYRSGEFVFSLGFLGNHSISEYLENKNQQAINMASIPSLGFVFSDVNTVDGKAVTEGWVAKTFSFGISRTSDYHNRYYFEGVNKSSSILDYFLEDSYDLSPDEMKTLTRMAFNTWLTDFSDSPPPKYVSALGADTGVYEILQTKMVTTKGSAYDMALAIGANYSNMLYIGGKIGVPFMDYSLKSVFEETNLRTANSIYRSSEFKSTSSTNGVGFNAGLGIIFKPVEYIRLGASVFSPTFYTMNQSYRDDVFSKRMINDTMVFKSSEFVGELKYNLTTPFRAIISAAIITGKHGFISADYEYVDYSTAYLASNDYAFNHENTNISEYFRPVNIFRVGGEFKLGIFALRAGYGHYPSPYTKNQDLHGRALTTYSFGGGFREKDYFLDIAWMGYNSSEFDLPYHLTGKDVEGAKIQLSGYRVMLTFGTRF